MQESLGDEKTSVLARRMVKEALEGDDDASAFPYLVVMGSKQDGKKINLGAKNTETLIGRGADVDFQIDDENISRHHASIKREWDGVYLEDLSSKNGIVLNKFAIKKPIKLSHGQEVFLGTIGLKFFDPDFQAANNEVLNSLPSEIIDDEIRSGPTHLTNSPFPSIAKSDEAHAKAPKSNLLGPHEYIIIALSGAVLFGLIVGFFLLSAN